MRHETWTRLRGGWPGNGNVALQKEKSVLICREETIKNGREITTFFLPRVEKSQVERNAVDLSANQTFNSFFKHHFPLRALSFILSPR